MTSSNEISVEKINPYEEIISRLTFPSVDYAFTISKEENFEGEWIYRIYDPTETKHKQIPEREYHLIRELMKVTSFCFNNNDDLSARMQVEKLIKVWKRHWRIEDDKMS